MPTFVKWIEYSTKFDYPYINISANVKNSNDLQELFISLYVRYVKSALDRGLFYRYEDKVEDLNTIRGKVSEHINMQDMEKIITAAILVGIKKYADRHPNLRRNVNHVIDIANGDAEIDVMATVDEVKPVQRRKTTKTRKK